MWWQHSKHKTISRPRNALEQVPSQTADFPSGGVVLGAGWTTLNRVPTSSICISFVESHVEGQDTSLTLHQATDNYSQMQDLNISASLQVHAIVGSGSATTTFARTESVKDDSTYFTAHAVTLNGARFVSPSSFAALDAQQQEKLLETLRPGTDLLGVNINGASVDLALKFRRMAPSDPAEFRRQCGDFFVAAIHEGAELDAVLKFDVHQKAVRESLSNEVKGSYSGAELNAKVASTVDTTSKNSQLDIRYHLVGGQGVALPTDQVALVDNVKLVSAAAASHPRPFTITLVSYKNLPSWSSAEPNDASIDFDELAAQYGRLRTLYDTIDQIQRQTDKYVWGHGVTLHELLVTQDEIKRHLDSLSTVASSCSQHPSKSSCSISPSDQKTDYEYRVLFPARKGFDEDVALDAAAADVTRVQNNVQISQAQAGGGGLNSLVGQVMVQRNLQELARVQKVYADLATKYPDGVKLAIREQWIEYPSKARCKRDPTSRTSGCLSNADIDQYASRIKTL
ncbi:MAG: hypothetical protein JWQ42_3828 [Edaphobacter sp.]|nr:hypothetical protein [Edaphobacter sp.]